MGWISKNRCALCIDGQFQGTAETQHIEPSYRGLGATTPGMKTSKINSALLLTVSFADCFCFISLLHRFPVLPKSSPSWQSECRTDFQTLSFSQMGAEGCNYDCSGKKSFDQKWAWGGVCWGINVELTSSAAGSSVEEEFRCSLQPQQCKAAIINKVFPRGC